MLTGVYPGVDVADVSERTGWELRVSADLRPIPPPGESELAVLRDLLATLPKAGREGATG
jgi:glutaconate CoA-transferase, subunit B